MNQQGSAVPFLINCSSNRAKVTEKENQNFQWTRAVYRNWNPWAHFKLHMTNTHILILPSDQQPGRWLWTRVGWKERKVIWKNVVADSLLGFTWFSKAQNVTVRGSTLSFSEQPVNSVSMQLSKSVEPAISQIGSFMQKYDRNPIWQFCIVESRQDEADKRKPADPGRLCQHALRPQLQGARRINWYQSLHLPKFLSPQGCYGAGSSRVPAASMGIARNLSAEEEQALALAVTKLDLKGLLSAYVTKHWRAPWSLMTLKSTGNTSPSSP